MPRLKVRFDDPEHGWIGLFIFADNEQIVRSDASHIYDSFSQLVTALGSMLDPRGERVVVWMEEPAELEMQFSRQDDVVRLEITSFSGHERPFKDAEFTFAGSYEEICLPFWRALRSLEGRYSPQKLAQRWNGYFPHRELSLLTAQLGKD